VRTVTFPSWVVKPDLAAARLRHTLTVLDNGKVLMVGGDAHASPLDSVMLYDPATSTWATKKKLSAGKTNHSAVRLNNGDVLAFAGAEGGCTYSNIAYLYDPGADSWTATGNLTGRRSGFGWTQRYKSDPAQR
jgi:hypothetical protein